MTGLKNILSRKLKVELVLCNFCWLIYIIFINKMLCYYLFFDIQCFIRYLRALQRITIDHRYPPSYRTILLYQFMDKYNWNKKPQEFSRNKTTVFHGEWFHFCIHNAHWRHWTRYPNERTRTNLVDPCHECTWT